MEKKQYELCVDILKKLNKAGVLNDIVFIGSWCLPFYKNYFAGTKFMPTIRTRDIDILVPEPHRIRCQTDIPEILKDLGFVVGFMGDKGYIKLEHPDLIVEFLVPEKGKGIDKPYPLPRLGVNATTLRFLTFLSDNVIKVEIEGLTINVPHPANFALHKLIIFQRRNKPDKIAKDKEAAVRILKALIEKGESRVIKKVFKSVPEKWQKKILKGVKEIDESEIESLLKD